MALAAFDTLEFVDELEKSGIPEKQARAISSAVRKSHESSDVATKADLREYESANRADFQKLELRLDAMEQRFDAKHESLRKDIFHEIRELESRLMVKLGGLIVAGVVVIAALPAIFKYLHVG